jgi:Leucine-rich repeat (LRR) protein
MLTKLDFLSLKHNDLSGTIPEALVRLSKLDYLDLKFNQLTGTIPEFLGDLLLLEVLGLSKNSLEGTLPAVLGTLPLITLAIDDNMLTGDLTFLGSISTLAYLYAEDNDFGGSLDQGFFSDLQGLIETDLSGNQLEAASFPLEIFSLPRLRVLDLSANEIVGSLPEEVPSNTVLEYLNLRLNSISSSIPDSISNLAALTHLDLEANSLTGDIPEQSIATMEKLTYLFLGKNPFRGGTVPESFQSLTALRELSLDDTQLEGGIPMWLERLTDLRLLDLRHNELTGSIEDVDFATLSDLSFLLLSNNKLVGQIPDASLSSLDALTVVALHHNGFIGAASDICAADDSSVKLLTTDCGAVECDCCDDCCDGDSCYEGLVWDSLENSDGHWEEHFQRADYSFNPHILFDN